MVDERGIWAGGEDSNEFRDAIIMRLVTAKVGSLCEITSSKRIFASDYVSEGVPFFRGKEISEKFNGTHSLSTELFISRQKFEEIASKFGAPKDGDLLLTSVGTLGVPYLVRSSDEFYFKDGNLTWFREFRSIRSAYLYYWLLSPPGRAQLYKSTIGTSQAAYTIELLKQMQICLPPFQVQEAIISILSAYDALIENNRRRMKLLEESARQLYREWFVRLRFPGHEHTRMINGVPEGWKRKVLGEICTEIRENVLPKDLDLDTPYIGLEHIPRRSFSLTEWASAESVTSTKHRYKQGDILFGKIRPYFHKVGITFTNGVTSSDAIVIRSNSDELRSLVLMMVSSDEFIAEASQTMREGSKMPRADWKLMMKYPVTLPNQGLLDSFSEIVSTITDQLGNLCFQNQKLRTARDILLPRLMNGEITV